MGISDQIPVFYSRTFCVFMCIKIQYKNALHDVSQIHLKMHILSTFFDSEQDKELMKVFLATFTYIWHNNIW